MSGDLDIAPGVVIPASDLDYEYARSSGPGGQHVQTADTRVRLRFRLGSCQAIGDDVKARLRGLRPAWLTSEDELLLTSDAHRSRKRNQDEVDARLAEAIRAALEPPKKRKKTRPSRRAKQRRLDEKKKRGALKDSRKKIDD